MYTDHPFPSLPVGKKVSWIGLSVKFLRIRKDTDFVVSNSSHIFTEESPTNHKKTIANQYSVRRILRNSVSAISLQFFYTLSYYKNRRKLARWAISRCTVHARITVFFSHIIFVVIYDFFVPSRIFSTSETKTGLFKPLRIFRIIAQKKPSKIYCAFFLRKHFVK